MEDNTIKFPAPETPAPEAPAAPAVPVAEPLFTMDIPPAEPAKPAAAEPPALDTEPPAPPPGTKTRLAIIPNAPAQITIEVEGKPPVSFTAPRNVLSIAEALTAKLTELEGDDKTTKVSVSTTGLNVDTRQEVLIPLYGGTFQEVAYQLGANFMPATRAIQILQQVMNDLCEFSALKTLMVVGVWGDGGKDGRPGVGGFCSLNGKLQISAADVIIQASAIQGELDRFKDSMRKQGVQFPGDSKIVLPGAQGFRVPRPVPPGVVR